MVHRRLVITVPTPNYRGQLLGDLSLRLLNLPSDVEYTVIPLVPEYRSGKLRAGDIREHYPDFLDRVTNLGPSRILAVDSTASLLAPHFSTLTEDHGTMFYNPDLDSYVIPCYQFKNSRVGPSWKTWIQRDIYRWQHCEVPETPKFTLVETPQDFLDIKIPKGAPVIFDIETDGLDTFENNITKIGMSLTDGSIYIIEHPTRRTINFLRDFFHENENVLVGHNLAFDLRMLMSVSGTWDVKVYDTMLAAYILGFEGNRSLKHLATFLTNRPGPHAFGGPEDNEYLAEDLLSTLELYQLFEPQTQGRRAMELLNDLTPLTTSMLLRGVFLDRSIILEVLEGLDEERNQLLERLDEIAGVPGTNWNSGMQVGEIFVLLGVPLTEKTPSDKQYKVDAETLEIFRDHEVVDIYLQSIEYNKDREYLSSYIQYSQPFHQFVHPRLKLYGAVTGRPSCAEPNLQQVPRRGRVKMAFRSRFEGGYFGLLDLDQAELRTAAFESGDEIFAGMLNSDDPHRNIASTVFRMPPEEISSTLRKRSKGVTFGLMYGGTAWSLSKKIGVPEHVVEGILENFFGSFPKFMKYLEGNEEIALKELKIENAWGRIRYFFDEFYNRGEKRVRRIARNSPIQGSASDINLELLRFSLRAVKSKGLKSSPIMTVHDSMLWDIHPEEVNEVAEICSAAFYALRDTPFGSTEVFKILPITGELVVGKSWAEVESTNESYNPLFTSPCSSHVYSPNTFIQH